MVIEYVDGDESRIKWSHGDGWKSADLVDLIVAYEAEPKRGRWEFIGGYGYQYRCSECINCAERKTPYCPNCGADMRGGENGI